MNTQEMIEAILYNYEQSVYPSENYSGLRESLDYCLTLLKAEAEGRLLVLPCKVGDIVYLACASWIHGQPIAGTTSVKPVSFDPAVMWDFNNNHFRRHYFLTHEEAEAELREGVN